MTGVSLPTLILKCQGNTNRGTFGAHHREISRKTMRTAEISAAGQMPC
jgi:hypothetical protein